LADSEAEAFDAGGEQMLSKIRGLVSPEAFGALVKIFDSAWAAVDASGKLSAQEREAARNEIAKMIMDRADRPDLGDTHQIQSEILQLFWQSRRNSGASHEQ
jgi:hypothetical protein